MADLDNVFTFKLNQEILSIYFKNQLLYTSTIKRIMQDTFMESFEQFIFLEICEYNPQLGYYQYDFCKCFLNFAKELNK